MVAGLLFVVGTVALLFVAYVGAINVAAAFGDDSGDWSQALFAIIPAAVLGVGAFVARSRVVRRGRRP
jgi:hypothetical protein